MWKVKQWHYGNWSGLWYAYRYTIIDDNIVTLYFNQRYYESLSEIVQLLKRKGEAYEMAD